MLKNVAAVSPLNHSTTAAGTKLTHHPYPARQIAMPALRINYLGRELVRSEKIAQKECGLKDGDRGCTVQKNQLNPMKEKQS
jgi:hypothetical protein